jgi:hypothetical protein
VEILVANLFSNSGIEQNEISIAAYINCSLPRIVTEDHCRRGRKEVNQLLDRHTPLDNHLVMHDGKARSIWLSPPETSIRSGW